MKNACNDAVLLNSKWTFHLKSNEGEVITVTSKTSLLPKQLLLKKLGSKISHHLRIICQPEGIGLWPSVSKHLLLLLLFKECHACQLQLLLHN